MRRRRAQRDVAAVRRSDQVRGVDFHRVEHVDDQSLGERAQRLDIVQARCERIAEAAARSIQQDAAETTETRDQLRPARTTVRSSVYEHHGGTVTDLLDAHTDARPRKVQPMLGRLDAHRLPEPAFCGPIAVLVHREPHVSASRMANRNAAIRHRFRCLVHRVSPGRAVRCGRMAAESFLKMLKPDDADALVAAGRRQRHPARSRVFEEGDPGYEVLIVEQGSVKLVRVSTEGRELVVAVRSEGAILGELTAIDGGVRSTSATTLTPVQLLAIPFAEFRGLLDSRASVARALLDILAERLRESTDRVLEFGTADALTRVCRRLVEFADAQAVDDGEVFAVPLTQQEIASLSGLSREALVKALRTLRELDWIDVAGRNITLLDIDALRERAIG